MAGNSNYSDKVNEWIRTTLTTSPIARQQIAEGVATSALKQEATETPVEEPPIDIEVGLGSILDTPSIKDSKATYARAQLAAMDARAANNVGIDIPESGTATQKIATDKVLGTSGPTDYKQYTYGLDDELGAASSGRREGDVHAINLRAGDAGLDISTDSTMNPMDGSDGNPAFFRSRYPLLQTVVAPFKVHVPAYNLEATSSTLDPEKSAFQIATIIGGRPIPSYVG